MSLQAEVLCFWGEEGKLPSVPPKPIFSGDHYKFGAGDHPWHAPGRGHNAMLVTSDDSEDIVATLGQRQLMLPDAESATHWLELDGEGRLVVTYTEDVQRPSMREGFLAALRRLGVDLPLSMAYVVTARRELSFQELPSWAGRAVWMSLKPDSNYPNPNNIFYASEFLVVEVVG